MERPPFQKIHEENFWLQFRWKLKFHIGKSVKIAEKFIRIRSTSMNAQSVIVVEKLSLGKMKARIHRPPNGLTTAMSHYDFKWFSYIGEKWIFNAAGFLYVTESRLFWDYELLMMAFQRWWHGFIDISILTNYFVIHCEKFEIFTLNLLHSCRRQTNKSK